MHLSKAAATAAALFTALAGVTMTSTIANAGSSLCPSKKACIYLDANYNGLYGQKSGGDGLTNIPWENNDKMSSWENKTSRNGAWYYNADGGGTCKDMHKGSQNSYGFLDGVNDKLSSWRMNASCPD